MKNPDDSFSLDKVDYSDKWRLAAIAAPFMAAGEKSSDAVKKAEELVEAAKIQLTWRAIQAHREDSKLTLDGFLKELGLKKSETIRGYLFKVRSGERARKIWRDALAGKPVFDWTLIAEISGNRDRKRAERIDKATAARGKKRSTDI